ncbi:MAG: CHASE domain-containing protein [Sphingomonadaceae bacterium]
MRAHGLLAFIFGLCITGAACMLVVDAQQQQIRSNFQRDADKIARDTEVRLHTYFDVLLAIKGIYALDDSVDRGRFHRFVGELQLTQRYPGFQALQFVRQVPGAQLARFSDAVRRDTSLAPQGYPQFQVHPPQQQHDPHYIIEYTEPLKGNESAFGLDLAALPTHRQALELGAASGDIIATERITLVQDASGEPGFVARAPVYRNGMPLATEAQRRAALAGFSAIVFRVNTLMREVIEPNMLEHLRVRINDNGYLQDGGDDAPGPDNLMFDSGGKAGAPELTASAGLIVGQRLWLLQFEGRPGSRYSRAQLPVLLIGAAGILISALIGALLVASRRVVDAKHGLEYSLTELEKEKTKVEQARSDLARVAGTLKQAQTNLITSEKMAALGALVAGIAHELNTPIGNTLLTATALSDMVKDFQARLAGDGIKRSALEAHLADARSACDIMASSLTRAAELIQSFKQVAVDQSSGQRRRFLLDELVHDMLTTYAAQLRRGACEVVVQVPAGMEFDSYPGSLSQVLSNLIGNALLHGFDGRACGCIWLSASREGEQVRLVFRDDGVGMAPRTLHQIFDPFFTTKMGQGGSGLGMNIVYNIVTRVLRGTIEVESVPQQGTTITLLLPLSVPQQPLDQEAERLLHGSAAPQA